MRAGEAADAVKNTVGARPSDAVINDTLSEEYQARPYTAPAYSNGGPGSQQGSSRRSPVPGFPAPVQDSGAPGPRPATGFLRGLKPSTGCLMRSSRPGSPGAVGSPVFEVRGASLLSSNGGESPRPSTPKPSSQQHDSSPGKAPSQPAVYSIQARAGYTAMHRSSSGGSSSSTPATDGNSSSPHQQQQQHCPVTPAEAGASVHQAAAGYRQQQRARTTYYASPSASASSSARSSTSGADSGAPYTTYHVPLSLAAQGSSAVSQTGVGAAAPAYANLMHHNPLYSTADNRGAKSSAAATRLQPAGSPLPVVGMAGLSIATHAPASPKAGLSSAAGTPSAPLQAASNLTMVNDNRPISPGPFLSTYTSGTGPDSSSRPVSPHFLEQPPTPGSFATGPEAQGATPFCITAGQTWAGSASTSPVTGSMAAAVPGTAQAAVPPTGFRTPIYNRDGKFVGWKQNSNLLKPVATASVPSPPSSPAKGVSSSDQFKSSNYSEASVKAGFAPSPRGTLAAAHFAQYAAEPHKGFPDAENQVAGYVLGPVLGKGGFCSVRKALHELTGETVACKIIEKSRLKDPKDRDRVDRECRVMKNLSNHVCIIKMFEYVETPDYVYIMMEHCTKGSLLEYVRDKKKLPEEEAVLVLQQLLHSLQFCHRKDVVHRDIKLENILIDGEENMKLIDFGLCGYYVAGKRLRCHCGSPSYAAPEIVARKDYLGPPVDVWSLGIVLFAMLAGYLPFHAKEKKQLSEKILAGVYKPASWMSPEAQDLLARMLTLDPDQRITLEAAWAHPWVANARRWEPPGVGSGKIYRLLTEPNSGSVLPDEAVMDRLTALGTDTGAVRKALKMRECNGLTAAYHLMQEAHAEQLKQAAQQQAEKAAWLETQPQPFAWDFGCAASPRSPNRPRTASPSAAGSPTRFQPGAGSTAGSSGDVRMLPRDLPGQAGGDRPTSPLRPGQALPIPHPFPSAGTGAGNPGQDAFFIKAIRGAEEGGAARVAASMTAPVLQSVPSPSKARSTFDPLVGAKKQGVTLYGVVPAQQREAADAGFQI